jgi:hypothetical protein
MYFGTLILNAVRIQSALILDALRSPSELKVASLPQNAIIIVFTQSHSEE